MTIRVTNTFRLIVMFVIRHGKSVHLHTCHQHEFQGVFWKGRWTFHPTLSRNVRKIFTKILIIKKSSRWKEGIILVTCFEYHDSAYFSIIVDNHTGTAPSQTPQTPSKMPPLSTFKTPNSNNRPFPHNGLQQSSRALPSTPRDSKRQFTNFLSFPLKVRNLIYAHLLTFDERPIITYGPDVCVSAFRYHVAVLRLNRQIHDEAKAIFWRDNTMFILVDPNLHLHVPGADIGIDAPLVQVMLRYTTTVRVRLAMHERTTITRCARELDVVFRVLRDGRVMPSLQKIAFSWMEDDLSWHSFRRISSDPVDARLWTSKTKAILANAIFRVPERIWVSVDHIEFGVGRRLGFILELQKLLWFNDELWRLIWMCRAGVPGMEGIIHLLGN